MQAYVINLQARPDRWTAVQDQWHDQPFELIRVEAVSSHLISDTQSKFLPKPVVANWSSQCEVFRKFLESDEEFTLIFEDDFILGKANLEDLVELMRKSELDFLQLGFLYNSITDYINIRMSNLRDLVLKGLSVFVRLFPLEIRLGSKQLVREQESIDLRIVLNDARSGSHAYIVSRKFASAMLEVNTPNFLATDGLFVAISGLRYLRMGRLRKNLIRQSDSPSSIRD